MEKENEPRARQRKETSRVREHPSIILRSKANPFV
jgi:hypothetical protein